MEYSTERIIMDKRTTMLLKILTKMKAKYPTKRRMKNFDFFSGMIFECFRKYFAPKEALKYMETIKQEYAGWNEFRIVSLKLIQEKLGFADVHLAHMAECKKMVTMLYDAMGTFSLDIFSEKEPLDCLDFLSESGLDTELVAQVLVSYVGFPIMPLPDNILRLIKRLDVFPQKSSRRRIRTYFAKLAHDDVIDLYQTYRLFLQYADEVCVGRDPHCKDCFIARDCKSAHK